MGLGAGFKLGDHKEREKENIKEKDKSEKHKSRLKDDDDSFYDLYASSGWTSILEDWLCNGVGCVAHAKVRGAPVGPPSPGLQHLPVDRTPAKEPGKGPYQPLIKHRMMGLSLAVYIHRDLRSLVRGTFPLILPCVPCLILHRHFEVGCHHRIDWWASGQQRRLGG